MNEAVKPRFAVDLDEIERQLAQSQPVAPPSQRGDPLAELARIVGQEDPFHTLLGSERGRSRPQDRANLDDLFVTAGEVRPGSARDQQQELRSTFGGGDTFPRYEAPQPADHGAYDELAADEAYDDRQAQPPDTLRSTTTDFRATASLAQGSDRRRGHCRRRRGRTWRRLPLSSGSTILQDGRAAAHQGHERARQGPAADARAGSRSRTRTSRSTSAPARKPRRRS